MKTIPVLLLLGACLCACGSGSGSSDADGDGLGDLLVGAQHDDDGLNAGAAYLVFSTAAQ